MTYVGQLSELSDHGVSIWLDSLSCGRFRGGELAALVRDRHVVGVTTNSTIFEQALADSAQYDSQVHDLGLRGVSPEEAARSYVTQLVAPDTVNTMPEATLDAVADHAQIGTDTIPSSYEEAAAVLEALPRVGVDHEDVMSALERDGVQSLSTPGMTCLPISRRPCAPRVSTGLGCSRNNHRPQSWPTARLLKDDRIGI